MFVYLFLVAAITTSPALSTSDTEAQDLQELIAIFTSCAEDDAQEITITEQTTVTTITEPVVAPTTTAITLSNDIEPGMLAYKHWSGTYSPETFTIDVNGTEIAQGAQHTLPAETKTVDLSFNYSFMNGMRKGTKTVSYELKENITEAHITFAWKDDWQILVDNGTAVKKVSA